MTMDKAEKMFEWKNYPETRQFAIVSHEEIAWKDHLEYFEKNIGYFTLVTNSAYDIGAIRVKDGEISIWIDRQFWGQGWATKIIQYATRFTGTGKFTAKIVDGNIGSMRAFISAGFKPIKRENGYYIFAN